MTERQHPRILAVNDQPDFLDALGALLAGEGYDVVTTTSATDALRRADDFNPEVVITDLNMSHCDGVQFLRMLADLCLLPDVPKMILSSASEEVVRGRMRECGVEAEVFDKNGDVDVLLAAIRKACRERFS